MDVETAARKHALKNAFDFGRADMKAVVGKVIAEVPEARKDMKAAMAAVMRVVAQVNEMKKEEIAKELGQYEFIEKKEEEKGITLPNAEQGTRVVTRFPPEPNGYPHIGHAKAVFLDYEAARAYGGEFILRFDDTNPEAEKAEFVDAIKDALSWLGISYSQELYASDFMPKIYECAEKLISGGHIYACSCPQDVVKENRMQGKECACRSAPTDQNMQKWKGMLDGSVKKGEVAIRLKGDMSSLNTAMRDPTMFRIIESEHYRQGNKYRVWPSYDFQAPVLDSLNGVTHAMRTKEYELRDEMYYKILDMLGMRKPILVEFSRLSIKGMPISKRLLKPLIEIRSKPRS
ncbi:MAG: glutamate--tRNA ligase family protein [Candidatus Micrarchaeota archaeon]|nr:glutamate--tRNA ligase family protein [Candidatus Micrarchaeota archaeon]